MLKEINIFRDHQDHLECQELQENQEKLETLAFRYVNLTHFKYQKTCSKNI